MLIREKYFQWILRILKSNVVWQLEKEKNIVNKFLFRTLNTFFMFSPQSAMFLWVEELEEGWGSECGCNALYCNVMHCTAHYTLWSCTLAWVPHWQGPLLLPRLDSQLFKWKYDYHKISIKTAKPRTGAEWRKNFLFSVWKISILNFKVAWIF